MYDIEHEDMVYREIIGECIMRIVEDCIARNSLACIEDSTR